MSKTILPARTTELGTISVSSGAVAQIVGNALAESYGVVGIPSRRFPRLRRSRETDGVEVKRRNDGLEILVHVVVEYGLKLSEVAAVAQERIRYEVERTTGLRVASVEVRIEDARRS
jgi:uncharacterized alkaline shock family protein YloU